MSILRARNGQVLCRTADRPTSLCDPDRFAANSRKSCIIGVVEGGITVLNRIGKGCLIIWVSIHAYKVASVDDSIVATVDPSGPGV